MLLGCGLMNAGGGIFSGLRVRHGDLRISLTEMKNVQ